MVGAQTGAVFGLKGGKKPERQKKAKATQAPGQTDLFAEADETVDYDEDWDEEDMPRRASRIKQILRPSAACMGPQITLRSSSTPRVQSPAFRLPHHLHPR